jgi:hypothetical protein
MARSMRCRGSPSATSPWGREQLQAALLHLRGAGVLVHEVRDDDTHTEAAHA